LQFFFKNKYIIIKKYVKRKKKKIKEITITKKEKYSL